MAKHQWPHKFESTNFIVNTFIYNNNNNNNNNTIVHLNNINVNIHINHHIDNTNNQLQQ